MVVVVVEEIMVVVVVEIVVVVRSVFKGNVTTDRKKATRSKIVTRRSVTKVSIRQQ
jgi:hypothetical protein